MNLNHAPFLKNKIRTIFLIIKFKQISPINLGLILNSFTALSIQKRTKKSFQTSKVNSFKNDNILAMDSVMMRSAELDVELTKRVDQVIKVKIPWLCVSQRVVSSSGGQLFFFCGRRRVF